MNKITKNSKNKKETETAGSFLYEINRNGSVG
jgi:hypothetical protein